MADVAQMQKNVNEASSPVDSGLGTGDNTPLDEKFPVPNGDSHHAYTQDVDAGSIEHSGPDDLVPATSLYTTRRDAAVKLRSADTGPLAVKAISVPTLFQETVRRLPNGVALAHKRKGEWVKWTYQQYYDDVVKAAKSFIKAGLERYHAVGIIGFNCPEWFIADLGAIFAGGFASGIYTTNSPEACHYVAENCQANVIVVENDQQLQKILKIRDQLPHLKTIVQYSGEVDEKFDNVLTWAEFMDLGKDVPDSALAERIKDMAPNKCCTLIYTSGTTGNPKGVMLSHDNICWTARMAGHAAKFEFGEDHIISYLPLSHIAAQLVDIYAPMLYGATVWFAQPDALKGSLSTTMKEVRPTAFLGVPRVWEKMQEKMQEIARQNPSNLRKKIAAWAKDVGLRGNLSKMKGGSVPFGWTIANMLVFKKVRLALGLDRCRIAISAAAPIMKDTLEFFMSLDISVTEIYGMSESSGPHTVAFPWKYKLTSVGTEVPGVTTKLDNPDADGNGEICMYGRHVFMGYLNMEDKTTEAIDSEGWLHSGDVGKKDEDGFLYITGRIKELLITAGGENVAPVPIEDLLKEELPVVSNCMLIGDKKKFLAMLITMKTDVDPETVEPLDRLAPQTLEWCRSIGSDAKVVGDVMDGKDAAVLKAIQAAVDNVNKKAESNAKRIAKWTILPRDFSIPGDELGPTLKLKRPVVSKLYSNTISTLYGE